VGSLEGVNQQLASLSVSLRLSRSIYKPTQRDLVKEGPRGAFVRQRAEVRRMQPAGHPVAHRTGSFRRYGPFTRTAPIRISRLRVFYLPFPPLEIVTPKQAPTMTHTGLSNNFRRPIGVIPI